MLQDMIAAFKKDNRLLREERRKLTKMKRTTLMRRHIKKKKSVPTKKAAIKHGPMTRMSAEKLQKLKKHQCQKSQPEKRFFSIEKVTTKTS